MAKIVLVLGGARSGKSRFAQDLAGRLGGDRVAFIATAERRDDEMARRIALHQSSRPAAWITIDVTARVADALQSVERDVVLIDCLTLLVSNVLLTSDAEEAAESRLHHELAELLAAAAERSGTVIIVSGEVGSGIVPEYPLGRQFRDLLGQANQRISAQANAVYLLVAGLPVELRSIATTVERAAETLLGGRP